MARLTHILRHAPMMLAIIAVLTMIGATLIDVVGRNAFGYSLKGCYEIVQISLCVAIFAALGLVSRDGTHIVVDLIDQVIGDRLTHWLIALASLAVAALCCVLVYAGWQQAQTVVRYGETTSDLGLSKLVFWVPIMLGLVGGMSGALREAVARLSRPRCAKDEHP